MAESKAERDERVRNGEINRRNAERARQIEQQRKEEAAAAAARARAERIRQEREGGPTSRHPFRP